LNERAEEALDALLKQVRACRICEAELPLGPRPVLRARSSARLLIASQAPGLRVHKSGIPWDDPSGDTLREWLGLSKERFYDESQVAILPMGFCYPGRSERGGDLPPRKECAAHWHAKLLAELPNLRLTLLVGQYAQRYYLGERMKRTLTESVKAYEEYLPEYWPIPHPSGRNVFWHEANPWFESEVVPRLREAVQRVLTAKP
jgi:uracil-DNA glycosylase